MVTEQPIQISSVTAAADTAANLFIGFDGSVLSSAAKSFGVSNTQTNSGEELPVMTSGIALILSGASVSIGDAIESDSDAKAVPQDSGVTNGYSLDSASGADELIRVLLV